MAFQFVLFLIFPALSLSHVDPECHMDTAQIIEYNGYPSQTHYVTTEDGYILQLHRIPNTSPKGVIFLQHGLLDSSAVWVMNTKENSLAFFLADHGYDVWMGNIRGNTYSRNHTTLNPKNAEFWEYTFDEHAAYDLPAMLNYVLSNIGTGSLSYVGHSQGSQMAFIEFSRNRELARHIDLYVALAPVARISHLEGLFKVLSHFIETVKKIIDSAGVHEVLPLTVKWMVAEWAIIMCPLEESLCADIVYMMAGGTDYLNTTRIPVFGSHIPAGTSMKNILHWDQIYKARKLQMWDYGTAKENQKHYDSSSPPVYDISGLNIPTMFIAGGNDYLGDPRDVAWLEGQLKPGVVIENIFYDDYNHVDFMMSLNARERVYTKIAKQLSKLYD